MTDLAAHTSRRWSHGRAPCRARVRPACAPNMQRKRRRGQNSTCGGRGGGRGACSSQFLGVLLSTTL
eukprot:353252-Chlamydomonas_euryale.AAC.3